MAELWLTFADEYGDNRRVPVETDSFVIGRHPTNNLCISDSRLSRQHVEIERNGADFLVSDCNSSNGTTLNGERLTGFVTLKNGDLLNLGGGVAIQVEIVFDSFQPESFPHVENSSVIETALPVETASGSGAVSIASSGSGGSIPTFIFWLAPAFGIFVLMFVGGLFLAFSGKSEKTVARDDTNFTYSESETPRKVIDAEDEKPTPRPAKKSESTNSNSNSSRTDLPDAPPAPKPSGDAEKIEQNSAAFLRRIAINDPGAFLTGKQIEAVTSRINQLKGSSVLADNFKAVKKNSSEFESLANSKNLKPQFLAAAALVKIGNSRGEPIDAARTMLPVFSELKITLDNKLADDCLLMVAGYERGAAGKPRALQSILEAIAKQSQGVSPREIRSIWFLKDKGKITDAEFNFALQFIAVGTIMQNPKDFNVNADAVVFN